MSNFKEKCKAKLALVVPGIKSIWSKANKPFSFFVVIACISLTFIGLGVHSLVCHADHLAIKALNANQALFVNIVTEEVFNGAIHQIEVSEDKPQDNLINASPIIFRSPDSEPLQSKKRVSIVITNLGLSKNSTLEALELPKAFTLGFSPYAMDLNQWLEQSYGKGFESLINLPMQPKDYPVNDPGPLSMLINLSNGENLSRFDQVASKSQKCIGFYTDSTEAYSQLRSSFSPILSQIAERQFLLAYGNQENSSGVLEMCKSVNAECVAKSINIDDDLSEEKIKRQLLLLEGMLQTHNEVIAFAKSFPVTLKMLKKWITEIDPNEISIVPISHLVSARYYKNATPITLKPYPVPPEKEKPKDAGKEEHEKSEHKE